MLFNSHAINCIFSIGNFHPPRDTPLFTVHNTCETQDFTLTSVVESVVSVSQSDTDPPEDVLIPAVPPQPVLLEDPLILNSPRFYMPKKSEAVLKRNNWPQPTEFPDVGKNSF